MIDECCENGVSFQRRLVSGSVDSSVFNRVAVDKWYGVCSRGIDYVAVCRVDNICSSRRIGEVVAGRMIEVIVVGGRLVDDRCRF